LISKGLLMILSSYAFSLGKYFLVKDLINSFYRNDFIPNLPSLKIREGAIDALVYIYKAILPSLDGYLTQDGRIILPRLQILLNKLSLVEEKFFKQQLSYQAYLEQKKLEEVQFSKKSVNLIEEKKNIDVKLKKEAVNNEELKIFDELFDEEKEKTKSKEKSKIKSFKL